MTASIFFSIAATGFMVAFAHAALPTHWLPFVLAGRGQNWSRSKTLWITAFASLGHVLFTTLLGVLVVFLGIKVEGWLGGAFPLIVGSILILFGGFYLVRQWRGGGGHHHWQLPWVKSHSHSHAVHGHDDDRRIDTGHGILMLSVFEDGVPPRFRVHFEKDAQRTHTGQTITIETTRPDGTKHSFTFADKGLYLESHEEIPEPHEFKARLTLSHGGHGHDYQLEYKEHSHDHGHEHSHKDHGTCTETAFIQGRSDRAVIIGLLALLTFSPCEGFLPVYLSGIQYGWIGFIILSLVLAFATMAGMIFFTWLTLSGLERVKLETLEKYEAAILGTLLILLGALVVIFEHSV